MAIHVPALSSAVTYCSHSWADFPRLTLQESVDERASLAQYSPATSSAYGNALVSELRQDDKSFFSDKAEEEAQTATLAAALGQRRTSLLMVTTPSSLSSESLGSPRGGRRAVSRHVSHIGYGQQGKSRLRRSSNGEEDPFAVPLEKARRSSHDSFPPKPAGSAHPHPLYCAHTCLVHVAT